MNTTSEKISTHLMLVEDLIHQPKWWLIICGQKSTIPCKLGWANVSTTISQFAKGQKISKKKYVILDSSKNEYWGNSIYWKLPQHSFFGRIQDAIICFWDLLTFRVATHSQFSCSSTHAWSLSQARARLYAVKLNG